MWAECADFGVSKPFKPLKTTFCKDAVLELWMSGIYYTASCCVQASVTSLFVGIYRCGELEIGI
jgi:hypothetical protein